MTDSIFGKLAENLRKSADNPLVGRLGKAAFLSAADELERAIAEAREHVNLYYAEKECGKTPHDCVLEHILGEKEGGK